MNYVIILISAVVSLILSYREYHKNNRINMALASFLFILSLASIPLVYKSEQESIGNKEYREYASYDVHGRHIIGDCKSSLSPDPCSTDIYFMMREFIDPYEIRIMCDRADSLDRVISQYPGFPFAYYFKAGCTQENNIDDWKSYAKTALKILNYTTSVPEKHPDHLYFYKRVKKSLNDNSNLLDGVPRKCYFNNGGVGPCESKIFNP